MKFEFIPHTADIQFKAYGKDLEESFKNSAFALTQSICTQKIKEKKKIKINVKGKDLESLLYNFLEELLIFFDSEYFILSSIKKIKINERNFTLDAELLGDLAQNYEVHSHIKAVAYNEMSVKKEKDKWVIFVTLDV